MTAAAAVCIFLATGATARAAESSGVKTSVWTESVEYADTTSTENYYRQLVGWQIGNVATDNLESVTVEYSYDAGSSWTQLGSFSGLAGSVPLLIPKEKGYVRYRVTPVLKDRSSVRAKETNDILMTVKAASPLPEASYAATKVVMNVGTINGTDMPMKLLGVTWSKQQVWSVNNTSGNASYALWKVWGPQIEGLRTDFGCYPEAMRITEFNTLYSAVAKNDYNNYQRIVPFDPKYYFFFFTGPWHTSKLVDFELFIWDMENRPSFATSFALAAYPWINLPETKFDETNKVFKQQIDWDVDSVPTDPIDHIEIQQSFDYGNTWNTAISTPGTQLHGSLYTELPWEYDKVRYRLVVKPKDVYRVVVEHDMWEAESHDYWLVLPDKYNCRLKAQSFDRLNDFVYNADVNERRHRVTLKWNMPESIYSGGQLQYSTDNGTTWNDLTAVSTTEGTETVEVPVGNTQYMFRLNGTTIDDLANCEKFRIPAADTLKLDYTDSDLTINGFSFDSGSKHDTYKDLARMKVKYSVSDILWQTSTKAYISYSFDGKEWHSMESFAPEKSGTKEFAIPNDRPLADGETAMKYYFRLTVDYAVDGVEKTLTKDIDPIQISTVEQ